MINQEVAIKQTVTICPLDGEIFLRELVAGNFCPKLNCQGVLLEVEPLAVPIVAELGCYVHKIKLGSAFDREPLFEVVFNGAYAAGEPTGFYSVIEYDHVLERNVTVIRKEFENGLEPKKQYYEWLVALTALLIWAKNCSPYLSREFIKLA
jgi:hypothetical protein